MLDFFKKDSILLGVILGLIAPVVLFVIIYYLNGYFEGLYNRVILQDNTIMLVSIVLNVFVLRYFLTSRKRDKTGRGVLMATFAYTIVFFVFFLKSF